MLATEQMAVLVRIVRGAVLEVLPQDFIRTARGKGVSPGRVVWRHALSNAMLPVVTVIGFRIAFLAFTLLFVGFYAQGQLSVVNIFAIQLALRDGFNLDMFLLDREYWTPNRSM